MRYEIIYKYKKEGWLDSRIEWARNENVALIQFWTFIAHFRDKSNVEFVRIDEKPEVLDNAHEYDINSGMGD